MPAREPVRVHYSWRKYNPDGGWWHRLTANGETIKGAEVMVMPDMDRSRYFWYVRIGPKAKPTRTLSGHEATLEDAKAAAREEFDELY